MSIEEIVKELDTQIAQLQQARQLLSNGAGLTRKSTLADQLEPKVRRKKRVLSPEARKRIAEAQRKRWAAQKKAEK